MKTKMNFLLKTLIAGAAFAGLYACEGNPLAYTEDAHGRGKQTFYIEDSYKPLFETSIYTFEGQFPKADIVPVYCTQQDAIEAFFKKKTNTICIARDLTKEEIANLKKASVEVKSTRIAFDAVALIVHPDNMDTTLTIEELKRMINGTDSLWKTSRTGINVVFDNINSANFQYLRDLAGKKAIPKNVFAVKSNEEVINYVKAHPSAIGIIGVNWISDEDDVAVLQFRAVARPPHRPQSARGNHTCSGLPQHEQRSIAAGRSIKRDLTRIAECAQHNQVAALEEHTERGAHRERDTARQPLSRVGRCGCFRQANIADDPLGDRRQQRPQRSECQQLRRQQQHYRRVARRRQPQAERRSKQHQRPHHLLADLCQNQAARTAHKLLREAQGSESNEHCHHQRGHRRGQAGQQQSRAPRRQNC